MIQLSKIYRASEAIKGVVSRTPFAFAPELSRQSGHRVYLKKENLQRTGAYKLRGAYNKVASLSEEERNRGIIAASAGNHAQGVAYSAQQLGIKACIVMPDSTPLLKVSGVKSYGAEVILHGNNYDEAYAHAQTYAKEHNLSFIHPFEDEEVIAGQGTVALEVLEEAKDLDAVIVPVGGGGLISGVASAVKAINPDIKVIGVNASGAPALMNSFYAKEPIDLKSVKTIADGIAVRDSSKPNLTHILETVDNFVDVDDEEIASAILFLLEQQKIIVEGAGAVGVAALMHKKLELKKDSKIAIILTGGNIDVTMLNVIIEKGLIKSGRKIKIRITLIDKPGSLMYLTELLTKLQANIVHIGYDRTSTKLSYGDASVTVDMETKGQDHKKEVLQSLTKNGYLYEEIR